MSGAGERMEQMAQSSVRRFYSHSTHRGLVTVESLRVGAKEKVVPET